MNLSFCPFCRTITYYDKEITERAKTDPMVRIQCAFCHLKFWPGPVPTKQAGVAQW